MSFFLNSYLYVFEEHAPQPSMGLSLRVPWGQHQCHPSSDSFPQRRPLDTEVLPFLSTRGRGTHCPALLAPNTCLYLQRQQTSQAQALDRDPVYALLTAWALVKVSNGADHLSSPGFMEGNLSSCYLGCLLPHCLFKEGKASFIISCFLQVF